MTNPSTPDNMNTLATVQFRLDIERIPTTNFFMQTAMLPGMDMDQPTNSTARRNVPVTGSQLTFDPLVITFLVDEDLKNYFEIYRWMMSIIRTTNESENKSDATLHVLDGQSHSNILARFSGVFPTSIAELPFATTDTDTIPQQTTVTFNYSYFDFPQHSTVAGTDDMGKL